MTRATDRSARPLRRRGGAVRLQGADAGILFRHGRCLDRHDLAGAPHHREEMSLGHITGKCRRRGGLADLVERARHPGGIGRMDGGKIQRADDMVRQKHGLGDTAVAGSLLHRPQHDGR